MVPAALIEALQSVIMGHHRSWVAFKHGTCVVLNRPEGDLVETAKEVLRELSANTAPQAHDAVIPPPDHPGWIVTAPDTRVLTYIDPSEASADASDADVAALARDKRTRDATDLEVIHVEAKRQAG